ncbi:MAG: DUF2267 domain-containing protein [Nanoarchaeota archaeon]|nr:DUF2267 domain-containing protein [Nanoarchaeota archaeon]
MEGNSIEKTMQTTNHWLNELGQDLGIADKQIVYTAFKTVLSVIRDRLTVEEISDFAAELPVLIRGAFYEEWNPSKTPIKMKHIDEMYVLFLERYKGPLILDPKMVIPKIIGFLSKKVSAGEMKDIKSILPKELKEFWAVSESLG